MVTEGEGDILSDVQTEANPFGDLSEADYERLKADIATRGVLVPIEYDQDGRVVDGHNRLRICAELGIEPPIVVRTFANDRERILHQIALNTLRRHLSPRRRYYYGWNYEQMSLGLIPEPQEPPARESKPGSWNTSEHPIHAAERQRWHRLKEKLRPSQPVGPDTDPWQIAANMLDDLDALKPYVQPRHVERVEALKEQTRRLVWGPEG